MQMASGPMLGCGYWRNNDELADKQKTTQELENYGSSAHVIAKRNSFL